MFDKIKALISKLGNKQPNKNVINYEGYRFSVSDNFHEVNRYVDENLGDVLASILSKREYIDLGYELYNCTKYNTRELSDLLEYSDTSLKNLIEIGDFKSDITLTTDNVEIFISAYHAICMFMENLYKFTDISSETPRIVSELEACGKFQYAKKALESLLFVIPGLKIERINMYKNPELFKN